jgi:hypothetical protein
MDIYSAKHIVETPQPPEALHEAAWSFANELANDKWSWRKTHKVEITRSITEVLGEEGALKEFEVEPIYTDITISFSALKRYVYEGRRLYIEPEYNLCSTTSQDITKDEMPRNVLVDIVEDLMDEDDPQLEEDVETSLDDQDLGRVQEVNYTINKDGNIQHYNLSYSYTIDGNIVHTVEQTESREEVRFTSIRMFDGRALEARPVILAYLNEYGVQSGARDFDDSYNEFLLQQELEKLDELAKIPKEEHTRRALAMIALVSDGFVDLSKIPRR